MSQLEALVKITNSLAWTKKVAESYLSGDQSPLTNTFRVYVREDGVLAGPVEAGDKAKTLSKGEIDPISMLHLTSAFHHALDLLAQVSKEELAARERLATHQEFLVVLIGLKNTIASYLKWYGEQKNPKTSKGTIEVEDVA